MTLVRCNKADDPRCDGCYHAQPHEWTDGWLGQTLTGGHRVAPCATSVCRYTGQGVNCVKVKEEE